MKKNILLLFTLLLTAVLCACQIQEKEDGELKEVTLAYIEPAIHYAPIFVAMEQGYFKDEGLVVTPVLLETGSVMVPQVLAGTVDFALAGPEAPILSYLQNENNHPIIVAEVAQNIAISLVSRNEEKDEFTLNNILNQTIIGAKEATPAEVIFEYILINNSINFEEDLDLIRNIPVSRGHLSFRSGQGDYVLAGQPNVYFLEEEGIGTEVLKMSDYCEEYLYIGVYTSQNLISNDPEAVQAFINALCRAQKFINTSSAEEISTVIKSHYPNLEEHVLSNIIKDYQNHSIWGKTNFITQDHYNQLIKILKTVDPKTYNNTPVLEDIVNNDFIEKSPYYEK